MFYINAQPDTSGNHGNPISHRVDGMVALPDELLTDYIETKGFAYLTVEDDTVTEVAVNQSALDSYEATHPDPGPEPEEPTEEEDFSSMLVDHEYRLTLLELGISDLDLDL